MIPVTRPDLSGNEATYVSQAMSSTWISSQGPFIEEFEQQFAAFCGAARTVTVSSGTAGLHLVLASLGLGRGDEVIVPSLTFVATANAVRYQGAEPVFVDVDEATWTLDPDRLADALTPQTRGIIAVHLYGHPADMDAINSFADAHGLWVIEDAAEAHGAEYKGVRTGGLGTASVFSFYGNKILTCGEGGAVVTGDVQLAERMDLLKAHGADPRQRYYHPVVGYNYRLTNVACAILCAQLERVTDILRDRARVYARYREALADVPGLNFQPRAHWAVLAPWLFSVTISEAEFGLDRNAVAERLTEQQVDTRPFFVPLHTLPPYASTRRPGLLVTERIAAEGLNLPTYVGMTEEEIARVAEAIRAA